MKYIKVAVCDDEENVTEVISSTVRTAFGKRDVAADVETFVSASALLRRMNDLVFDLLFLDIDMPGMDGIAFGEKLRSGNDKTDIIYVSNREDRVFEALKVRPFGFVRKSRFLSDVADVITRYLLSVPAREGHTVTVQSKSGIVNVRADEIIYFEGSGKFQLMHVNGREHPLAVYRPMEKLESELEPFGFIRIHKGMLVNYRFISRILVGEVELTDGEKLPLSRRKATEIKQRYLELLSGSGSVML